ncbi:MAG TPA: phytanoyl-CoA dioxygenase family protein [Myxococcota bacterium]|nr:phytanoyl-CoA dioxygenase family protein [Myxococcota bacterium]
MALSTEQIDRYRADGVVLVPKLLAAADLAPLQTEIEAWIDGRARELRAQGHLDELFERASFERRFACLYEASGGWIAAGLDVHLMRGPALFDFLRSDALLDAVESLVGPEIVLNPVHHLRAKLPQRLVGELVETYFNVPWHQDSGVLWEEADPVPIVGAWIPLVDATKRNGCMEVMPGVAAGGHLPHQAAGGTTIVPEALPAVEARTLECPRGGAIFQSKFTPHRSTPNETEGVRWSLDVRYQPAGTPTGRPFHPAFLVRSACTPEAVVRDHAAWDAAWRKALAALEGKPAPRAHRVVR